MKKGLKKGLIVFLRATFVVLSMLVAAYFGLKYYYQNQSKQAIERALVATDAPMIGDTTNPFTLVEFFDYRCPHCASFSKIVQDAVGDDIRKTTKIILRPTVVSDEQSYKIAMLVLAADRQKSGESVSLHKEIMNLTAIPTYETVKAMAQSRGINIEQAEKDGQDYKFTIGQNTAMLRDIGFYGVPALVIGDKGYVPRGQMPGINELRLMMIDAKTRLKIPTN